MRCGQSIQKARVDLLNVSKNTWVLNLPIASELISSRTNELLNDKLEEVQNELNEAREEADWANDELEDTNDKLRDKENALKSAMKGLKELAEKLGNSTLTVEQLDSIKEDIEEMTCMLNLEFE